MLRTFNEVTPPSKLTEYFALNSGEPELVLRRRSVLTRSNQGGWILVLCVIQAFPDPARRPEAVGSHSYDHVILSEDWLSIPEAQAFVSSVQRGEITLGEIRLERKTPASWQTEFVSKQNSFMNRVGVVVQTKFEDGHIGVLQEPLISGTAPYYPDGGCAAQDWLDLVQYHGASDGRNGHVVFLLPEARAFVAEASSNNGLLCLTIGGSAIRRIDLLIKGAYWEGAKMHHFGREVLDGHVELEVPDEVDRLEYVLIDGSGQIYDFQREVWGAPSGLVRKRTATTSSALIQQIEEAREFGESETIEFKPFVDPNGAIGPVEKKSKLRELIRTVAAFANTRGGSIYLGIDDECTLKGVQDSLMKWGQSAIGEELFARYKGAFTSKIRNELVGDARFRFVFATLGDTVVGIITVSPFELAPVGLRDEPSLYVRRGGEQ